MSDRPSRNGDFASKFRLALEALNLSRARCAQALGIDKSMVARWANGSGLPTEHNPTRITALIQRIRPEATLGMWRFGLDEFAGYLDPSRSPGKSPALAANPPIQRDRASVAVLAFDNLSGDPEQRQR